MEAGLAGDGRLSFVHGPADELPLPNRSVDAVVSSFVFQLVPDRLAALREAYRLLRPAGRLAYVTWIDRDARQPFRPADEFDEAVLDLQIEEPDEPDGCHAGDVPSARSAAGRLRRAGFRGVFAREDTLVYDWTLDSYLDYKLAYDERALMEMLTANQRRELEANARARLSRLSVADFRWHTPIVSRQGVAGWRSYLSGLVCTGCGATYDADQRHGVCPASGKVLFARYDLERLKSAMPRPAFAQRPSGLWRYREVLPVRDHVMSPASAKAQRRWYRYRGAPAGSWVSSAVSCS